jgi:hypothetical protein
MIRVLKPGGTILLHDMFPMIGLAVISAILIVVAAVLMAAVAATRRVDVRPATAGATTPAG